MNPFPNIVALLVDVPSAGVQLVTAATGLYVVPQAGGYVPCDSTGGPIPIAFPIAAQDQTVIIIADTVGQSVLSPISYSVPGSALVFDASWSGSGPVYGSSGRISLSSPGAVWFVFVASANKWMPGN